MPPLENDSLFRPCKGLEFKSSKTTDDRVKKMKNFGRNCPNFDQLTRRLFGLDPSINLDEWEIKCVDFPRIRRGSVELSEKIFFSHLRTILSPVIFEIGGNIGRHSRLFLKENIEMLHTFEPNIELFSNYYDIIGNNKFIFNPFGLSSHNGVKNFNIVTSVEGMPAGTTHGMGSFENVGPNYQDIYGTTHTKSINVGHFRADTYLEAVNIPETTPLVVWLDVEGHALEVLRGFGEKLSRVKTVIVELETDNRYIPKSNADAIINLCAQFSLTPVWRDMQYYGRFNVIFSKVPLENIAETSEVSKAQKFIDDVRLFSL